MLRKSHIIVVLSLLTIGMLAPEMTARRRMTPVDTPATATQAINETKNDTSRINAKRRAASVGFVDDRGRIVYVDTITGEEWIDSAAMNNGSRVPKMEFPLFHAMTVGVNVWDPVMRAFGQKYGLASAW
ncbi:MAG: hypothetical protein K2F79_05990, partial [Muribaculaceae bacterium]|nr:hypothetical protein [Muribaculaceae bacterium]